MIYEIFLRDKTQIKITENDYNNISQFLGKLKLFKLEDGQIVNAVDISRISPLTSQDTISKQFRLSEPQIKEEKRIKVPGGWTTPNMRERMIKLFNQFKKAGKFREFKDYFEWEKATYKDL